jgi:methyl-accepting chemotaxis protein
MFKKRKLKAKLLAAFLTVGIVPFAILAVVALHQADNALTNQAFNQLVSMRDVKKAQIERYLETIRNQAITFSENRMIVQAMTQLDYAYDVYMDENGWESKDIKELRAKLATYYTNDFSNAFREQNDGRAPDVERILRQLDDTTVALQYSYIKTNPNPLGSKHKLDKALEPSQYSQVHGQIHPFVRSYLEKFGYYDIFLVAPETGNVVYTVFKELDYATSLVDGPYADTGLGEAYRLAKAATSPDFVAIVDFKPYFPSYDAPAGFVASPIFAGEQKVGVLIFQFPIDGLNAIMKERTGMGDTGETYLVGGDLLMRSDSFLDPENHSVVASFRHPEKGKVDTEASRAALKGDAGDKVIVDYTGNPVLSAYTPLDFNGKKWGLLAEIDEAEALAAVKALRWIAGIVALIGVSAIVVVALLITRSIVKPVQGVVGNLKDLAQGQGDLTVRLPVTGNDEVGDLARCFNEFMEKLHIMIKDIVKGIETLSSSATELSAISQQMSASAEQTATKSRTVATSAEEMSANMNSVSSAMEQSSTNTGMVASAAEEMTATISDIAKNAEKARTISVDAVQQTQGAGNQMAELGKAAQAIGKVTETITEISEQTNLLALNATIEAARAGDAGKGFAVVANEIKELAKQTAEATLDIRQQIEGIQNATGTTVQSIDQIGQVIENVNKIVSTIATAVEEQSTSTKEIADNIAQASSGIEEVNENVAQSSKVAQDITKEVSEVNQASAEIANSSSQVLFSADELSALAEQLNEMVGRFKV